MMTRKFNQLLVSLGVTATLLTTAYPQSARTVMVQSNSGVVIFPTNLWSANAAAARSGLGLGSAATNSLAAFQPSSTVLSNLASSNAVNLTNLRASNIVGVISASNLSSVTLSNLSGTLSVAGGGTGSTNAAGARTNLGLGQSSSGAVIGLAGLNIGTNGHGIGTGAFQGGETYLTIDVGSLTKFRVRTNAVEFLQPIAFNGSTNNAGNIAASRANLGFPSGLDALWTATNAAQARQQIASAAATIQADVANEAMVLVDDDGATPRLSYDALGGDGWVVSDASGFRAAIGLGASWLTNTNVTNFRTAIGLGADNSPQFDDISSSSASISQISADAINMNGAISWSGTNATANAATTRTNLGLGWSALTNTNSSNFGSALFGVNTNPVLVNTSGVVVSPTNFWSGAPGAPAVQSFTPIASATNNITNARTAYVFSLATNVSGVTHTLQLPSGSVSEGDVTFVVHNGPTNSSTAIRVSGTTNNLISITGTGEAVQFIYRSGSWGVLPNPANVAPIYFSGASASNNAAISRTNLALPWAGLTNTNASGFRTDLGLVWSGLTNTTATGVRNDLGLVLTALTSSSATAFQGAIFTSTNAAPTNTTNVNAWVDIRVGTNDYKLPLYK